MLFKRQVIPKNMRNVVFNSPGWGATGDSKTGVKTYLLTSALSISQQLEISKLTAFGQGTGKMSNQWRNLNSLAKIMIWGAMTTTGASARHLLLRNQAVTTQYYQEIILAPFLLEEIRWNLNTGHITETRWIWFFNRMEPLLTQV